MDSSVRRGSISEPSSDDESFVVVTPVSRSSSISERMPPGAVGLSLDAKVHSSIPPSPTFPAILDGEHSPTSTVRLGSPLIDPEWCSDVAGASISADAHPAVDPADKAAVTTKEHPSSSPRYSEKDAKEELEGEKEQTESKTPVSSDESNHLAPLTDALSDASAAQDSAASKTVPITNTVADTKEAEVKREADVSPPPCTAVTDSLPKSSTVDDISHDDGKHQQQEQEQQQQQKPEDNKSHELNLSLLGASLRLCLTLPSSCRPVASAASNNNSGSSGSGDNNAAMALPAAPGAPSASSVPSSASSSVPSSSASSPGAAASASASAAAVSRAKKQRLSRILAITGISLYILLVGFMVHDLYSTSFSLASPSSDYSRVPHKPSSPTQSRDAYHYAHSQQQQRIAQQKERELAMANARERELMMNERQMVARIRQHQQRLANERVRMDESRRALRAEEKLRQYWEKTTKMELERQQRVLKSQQKELEEKSMLLDKLLELAVAERKGHKPAAAHRNRLPKQQETSAKQQQQAPQQQLNPTVVPASMEPGNIPSQSGLPSASNSNSKTTTTPIASKRNAEENSNINENKSKDKQSSNPRSIASSSALDDNVDALMNSMLEGLDSLQDVAQQFESMWTNMIGSASSSSLFDWPPAPFSSAGAAPAGRARNQSRLPSILFDMLGDIFNIKASNTPPALTGRTAPASTSAAAAAAAAPPASAEEIKRQAQRACNKSTQTSSTHPSCHNDAVAPATAAAASSPAAANSAINNGEAMVCHDFYLSPRVSPRTPEGFAHEAQLATPPKKRTAAAAAPASIPSSSSSPSPLPTSSSKKNDEKKKKGAKQMKAKAMPRRRRHRHHTARHLDTAETCQRSTSDSAQQQKQKQQQQQKVKEGQRQVKEREQKQKKEQKKEHGQERLDAQGPLHRQRRDRYDSSEGSAQQSRPTPTAKTSTASKSSTSSTSTSTSTPRKEGSSKDSSTESSKYSSKGSLKESSHARRTRDRYDSFEGKGRAAYAREATDPLMY